MKVRQRKEVGIGKFERNTGEGKVGIEDKEGSGIFEASLL